MAVTSPFLSPGVSSTEGSLALLHLRRDHSIPTILSTKSQATDSTGYAEGNVINTRFGSFPHTTLVNQPWGTQIRASIVDTGSRGRPAKKRKRETEDEEAPEDGAEGGLKEAITASSGFLHLLPPTPENWTTSLPHRTQVVYTPDYSYILHRIRARPGGVLIEAGSGSGSFTHAGIRAVFNGYPDQPAGSNMTGGPEISKPKDTHYGHVFTYEYHHERYKKVTEEMVEHGLANVVTTTHRDVYNGGFLLDTTNSESSEISKTSPGANAIFLDLPAPWMALPHLTRKSTIESPSPLDPSKSAHICTFSPCIEQAQRTVSSLRQHGWVDIEMVEMVQKRIDIRREYTGLEYEGMRGANGVPQSVEDAVHRLREIEERAKVWRGAPNGKGDEDEEITKAKERLRLPTDAERREAMKKREKTLYKEGRLVHRSEPELKTHTSYLVFAILPREWSEEDELKMRAKWNQPSMAGQNQPKAKSKKQIKRDAKQKQKSSEAASNGDAGDEPATAVGQDHGIADEATA